VTRSLSRGVLHLVGACFALFVLAAGGCARPPHQTLDDAAEPLRSAFNRDVGRVRVMMLVAPT
jgi:hypothetical protein